MYESELTRFMKQFMAEHPEEIESQKRGRAIWWDKDAANRVPPAPPRHAPKAGGYEHTFQPWSEPEKK